MSIPLVQNNEKDSINTSIIAIKRNIERINMLLGLSNSEEIDTSGFVKKSDIVDVVEAGNMNPVTSNAVVPVDEVTSGNMHSVTSNAVASAFEWKDIGSYVTLSKSTASGYFTNYTIENKTCFMTKNMVKLKFECIFSSSLASEYKSLKVHVTSSKFTMKREVGRVSSTSYFGGTIIGILTNEYSGETNAITIRIPSGSTIKSGSSITISVMFPI